MPFKQQVRCDTWPIGNGPRVTLSGRGYMLAFQHWCGEFVVSWGMSLVDYSSDEDEPERIQDSLHERDEDARSFAPMEGVCTIDSRSNLLDNIQLQQQEASVSTSASSNITQTPSLLPNASELLDAFEMGQNNLAVSAHFTRGADTIVASTSRKRPDLNGASYLSRHSKIPRGNLVPSRIPLDTAAGVLLPPQLRGRSNVATEDLDRLFNRRQNI
eukprot:c27322_g1_i1 orf=1835-2479(+)